MPTVGTKPTASKKPAKKSEVAGKKCYNGLSPSQIKTLQALLKKSPQTRTELASSTGIDKGWSKILGTKDGGHEDALEPRGLVKSSVPPEGERGIRYQITGSGKQALAKAEKEMAKG